MCLIFMKRGLIASFIIATLLFSSVGVFAQDLNYDIGKSTSPLNQQVANIIDEKSPLPSPELTDDSLNEDIEIKVVSPLKKTWDTALYFIAPLFRWAYNNAGVRTPNAAAVRG